MCSWSLRVVLLSKIARFSQFSARPLGTLRQFIEVPIRNFLDLVTLTYEPDLDFHPLDLHTEI